jgi:sugar transferase (PEP-CTERM/EpsH1 system associated)
MESLLFLAHRLPYPPNKGDKVRSFHFLRHLATSYRVLLGTFIDDAADWEHLDAVRRLCADVHVEPLAPWAQRARSATAFLRGEALTLPYFRSRALQHWVRRIVRQERIRRAFAFSSPMAQYLADLPQVRSFVDFVDMDSAKWGDYASRRGWPASALYGREARHLLAYEQAVAARAEASIFVTEEETQRFIAATRHCAERVVTIRNGVDSDYFSPSRSFDDPFHAGERPIVFTGAMDYWPNVDAVVWFAREVLPQLTKADPSIRFYVVGMNPNVAVRALARDAATIVTGRVPDVRPYLRHARVVVAPLRVARGIQNKVLEAMAMAKPVVTTPACAAAISAQAGTELAVAADAETFAAQVRALMQPERGSEMGRRARARILESYAWPASFARLDELLAGPQPAAAKAMAG